MPTRRTSHTVYDTKYHLVWAPKYRKWVLRGDIRERVEELFREIGDRHDIEIDTSEVAGDRSGGRLCSSVCVVSASAIDIGGGRNAESKLGEGCV
jgi:hypothetical protein